ncbi:MAG TPA: 1-acyl-sn-glycerol-3-phosphate acyltransferase [Acidimicrobiales bacterium]|nr:1-acyl-sn-glycerol-3-phosphate acyltransferase [Acidimicrobiales bacterium]
MSRVPIPPRRLRRALSPITVGLVVLLALGCAVGAVVGLVPAAFRRTRLLRFTAFGCAYCVIELMALGAAGFAWLRRPHAGSFQVGSDEAWTAANRRILATALRRILAVGRSLVGFEVVLAAAPEPEQLTAPAPLLVLARHAGPGDSFALAHLLLNRYGRGVRIVLKEALVVDPALDVLLHRLGSCFLPAGADDREERMADTARRVGPGDTLLLFPEGSNWTPGRRLRAIHRLRSGGQQRAARAAALMEHVLPPRPAGLDAVLSSRPDLAVVVVAHAGLDELVTPRAIWAAVPFRQPMTVRAWPVPPPPPPGPARRDWLEAEWAVVDEWVAGQRAAGPL